MLSKSHPLWMPRGSVRGLIALAFTAGTIAGVFTLAPEQVSVLIGLTGIIIKSYFDDRKSESASA